MNAMGISRTLFKDLAYPHDGRATDWAVAICRTDSIRAGGTDAPVATGHQYVSVDRIEAYDALAL